MANAAAVPVLMYHHVSPSPGLVTVSPENFRAQMRWLARNGWRGITCDEFSRFLKGDTLPDRSVLITFDDGYLDNWVHAAPILAEYGLHAVLFLITGRIGEGSARSQAGRGDTPACPSHRVCQERISAGDADSVMLRWSEVAAMHSSGVFEFHSHTHTHTRWDKIEPDPLAREQRLAEDLAASRSALAEHLGRTSEHLCWPQGYHDESYRQTARASQFNVLYTVKKGVATSRTDPARVPRMVAKDKADGWFASRMRLYRHPALTALYLRLRGE
jgi:peptidoglycan/xylan/chitin deacetylase (PgdA/CDA1 family)